MKKIRVDQNFIRKLDKETIIFNDNTFKVTTNIKENEAQNEVCKFYISENRRRCPCGGNMVIKETLSIGMNVLDPPHYLVEFCDDEKLLVENLLAETKSNSTSNGDNTDSLGKGRKRERAENPSSSKDENSKSMKDEDEIDDSSERIKTRKFDGGEAFDARFTNILPIGQNPYDSRIYKAKIDFGTVFTSVNESVKKLVIQNYREENALVKIVSISDKLGFSTDESANELVVPGNGPPAMTRKEIIIKYSPKDFDGMSRQIIGHLKICINLIDFDASNEEDDEEGKEFPQELSVPLCVFPKRVEEVKMEIVTNNAVVDNITSTISSHPSCPPIVSEHHNTGKKRVRSNDEDEKKSTAKRRKESGKTKLEEEVTERKKEFSTFHILCQKVFQISTLPNSTKFNYLPKFSRGQEEFTRTNLKVAILENISSQILSDTKKKPSSTIKEEEKEEEECEGEEEEENENENTILKYLIGRYQVTEDLISRFKKTLDQKKNRKKKKRQEKIKLRIHHVEFIQRLIIKILISLFHHDPKQQQQEEKMKVENDPSFELLQMIMEEKHNSPGEKRIFSILSKFIKSNNSDEETILHIFDPILNALRSRIIMTDFFVTEEDVDYRRAYFFLEWISSQASLRRLIAAHPNFLGGQPIPTGQSLEHESFFGPFLRFSTFSGRETNEIGRGLFRDLIEKNHKDLQKSNGDRKVRDNGYMELHKICVKWRYRLRSVMNHMTYVFTMFLNDLKTRPKIIHFFDLILKCNEDKSKIRGIPQIISQSSSHAFFHNVTRLMLSLHKEILQKLKTTKKKRVRGKHKHNIMKISSPMEESYCYEDIDGLYAMTDRLHLVDSTKMCMKENEAKEEFEKELKTLEIDEMTLVTQRMNLLTQMYFLAMKAAHLGLISGLRRFLEYRKAIREAKKQMDIFTNFGGGDQVIHARRMWLDCCVKKWSDEVLLCDPNYNQLCGNLYLFNQEVLLNLIHPNHFRDINLITNDEIPLHFRWLPQFFLTDMLDHFLALKQICGLSKHAKELHKTFAIHTRYNSLIDLLILLLGNEKYFSNFHELMKIPEIFFSLSPLEDEHEKNQSPISRSLFVNPRAQRYLMKSMMKLYVDVELRIKNSDHLKYEPRAYIGLIIEKFWKYDRFQGSFVTIAREDRDLLFTKFFNMNINDCTYLLETCIKKLKDIHQYEELVKNEEEKKKKTHIELTDLEGKNRDNRRFVENYMGHAKIAVHLLNIVSRDLSEYFDKPFLIERIAEMLNFFLLNMVEDARELVVSDRDQLNFKPREWLIEIVDCFLNLSHIDAFVRGVARDMRSYKGPDLFKKACDILIRRKIKSTFRSSTTIVEKFQEFSKKVVADKDPNEEIPYDKIEKRFICPISYELMEDPVQLPSETGEHILDRKSAMRCILNKEENPLTKQILTMDMLIPLPKLKGEIQEFVRKEMEEMKKNKV